MPSNPPIIIHSKPANTHAAHLALLLGTNTSTAIAITAHTSPTPLFILKNSTNYVGIRTVS